MALVLTKQSEQDFEQIPAGTYFARCYQLIDLGSQEVTYPGKPPTLSHKVLMRWEVASERMQDGRAFTIGKKYTFSSSTKSNLYSDLVSWRGEFPDEDFHLSNFVMNQPCMITVVHKTAKTGDKVYAEVASVASIPKGMEVPALENSPVVFSLQPGEFKPDIYDTLSEYLKKTIAQSPEYQARVNESIDTEDDLPF